MNQHPLAEVLTAIAEGKQIEKYHGMVGWNDIDSDIVLIQIANDSEKLRGLFRVKPNTIRINGFVVPKPATKPLEYGQFYWVTNLSGVNRDGYPWRDDCFDTGFLDRGQVHLDYGSAVAHTNALLSFTKK